jgi:hypothetical protein
MVESIITEQLLMTFISLILILLNGENQRQKVFHLNQEEAMLQVYKQIKIDYLFLEDGTSFYNLTTSLSMIC